ncbi:MAG: DNA polymerase IV [Saprospiraceae bacterium]|nr:DNA polymerase IV [Saprospiraceae bacterium]
MRKIIHIDMDAFFASVEQRDHPELRGKPIAVGGGGPRGVVAAASYEARQFGVRSAMSGAKARQLCPQLIFVRHNFEQYKAVSQQIRALFAEYTDLVEPLSLDEAYLDVTNPKMGPPSATLIARELRQRIFEATQLTASAGVSYCKFLAKMASDLNKPNGMAVILPHEAEAFLEKLPIEKFHGIGKSTAAKMHRMGIHNGYDLKQHSLLELARRFGKAGRFYHNIVRGIDERPVRSQGVRKSISTEHTFATDLDTTAEMMERLTTIAEALQQRIEHADNPGRTLTLKVKYADFHTVTRSKTLEHDIATAPEMLQWAASLLADTEALTRKVRLLGLGVSNLRREHEQQQAYFGPGEQLTLDF